MTTRPPILPNTEAFHIPNPKDILHEIEQGVDKLRDDVVREVKAAEGDALGALKSAENAALSAINKAGKAELDALNESLADLKKAKDQIANLEGDVVHIADHVFDKVKAALESAAARVAQDALQDVVDLVDDMAKDGIEGPSFDLQLGIVSCAFEDPIHRVQDLKDAIKDGIKGYTEIKQVVNTLLPDTVTLEFSAEIEFLVVSSNALEAGVSMTVSRDDLETCLELFLKHLGLL